MIHGRIEETQPADQDLILMKEAAWPVPFRPGLEYNSPCHGPWNIVHIGMAVPKAHQIYVCGSNCNRGVVLTAAEMKASDRYSTLTLCEDDLINGDMENLIIDGVKDILSKLPEKPEVVFLFTVCVHRFMGLDLFYVYSELRRLFPRIRFVESTMEPISQKGGLTPEQRLRDGMHSFISKGKKDPFHVSIIGSDFMIEEESELKQMLHKAGIRVTETSHCGSLEEYLSMGDSGLLLCCYPTALYAVEGLSRKLEVPYLYLPFSFSYEENARQLSDLSERLKEAGVSVTVPDLNAARAACEEALAKAGELIGDTALAIDAHAVPRPLGLARLLITHGFRVVRLYADSFSLEEKADYEWLRQNAPKLTLSPMIHPAMRVRTRGQEEKVLAIGQKAAYFHDTPYFVNIVQGMGMHGYAGIIHLIEEMTEAYLTEKDTRDLVGRKGLGCESY